MCISRRHAVQWLCRARRVAAQVPCRGCPLKRPGSFRMWFRRPSGQKGKRSPSDFAGMVRRNLAHRQLGAESQRPTGLVDEDVQTADGERGFVQGLTVSWQRWMDDNASGYPGQSVDLDGSMSSVTPRSQSFSEKTRPLRIGSTCSSVATCLRP